LKLLLEVVVGAECIELDHTAHNLFERQLLERLVASDGVLTEDIDLVAVSLDLLEEYCRPDQSINLNPFILFLGLVKVVAEDIEIQFHHLGDILQKLILFLDAELADLLHRIALHGKVNKLDQILRREIWLPFQTIP
jgi:hypothetical protein